MAYQDTSNPDFDRANQGTLSGLLEAFRKHAAATTDNMLPATIVAYDRNSNLASVQPSVNMVGYDGVVTPRASLASLPVLALGGGGFFAQFPLVAGNRGWIKASDRDISLYMQKNAQAAPNTQRMHSFSDGLFIPDIVNGHTISGEDANNFVLQNTSGSYRIAIWPDRIKITTPNTFTTIQGDSITINANGSVVVMNSTGVTVTTPLMTINGNLVVNGNINSQNNSILAGTTTITGELVVTGDIHAGGVGGKSSIHHVHTNGNGGANTGQPV